MNELRCDKILKDIKKGRLYGKVKCLFIVEINGWINKI
jgi:hypothetical protein